MESAGGAAWPARGGPGDSSSIRREIPSPAWEPPQKKVRNNAFHTPASSYSSQETLNYAREDGQGGFPPSLSHPPPVHAAGEQVYGGQESFGTFSHGQGMPSYGGQHQMQPSNGYAQDASHAPGRDFNMPPSAPTPGFPPGSAKGTGALFLKTKLCTKFKLGTCTFNERCHFAHGMEDLRKPPVGWETMVANAGQGGPFSGGTGDGNLQQRKKSTKPCRFFAGGKECPYGDKCTFVHVAGDDVYPSSGFGGSEGGGESGGLPVPRLKTRMCARWERGEACNYGERCHYAHGYAELQSDTGVPAYINDTAPAANNLQYPNSNLEFATQFSTAKNMNAPLAAAPPGGSFPLANAYAPSSAYPTTGTGTQQPVDTFTRNQGYWNGNPAQGGYGENQASGSWMVQGGYVENQTPGSWTGHPYAEGGYSRDPQGAVQYLPTQVQQPVMGQSYITGNVGIYQDPKQSVTGIYADPKQSANVPYVQDGGNPDFQNESMGGHGGYYPATYLPNHPN